MPGPAELDWMVLPHHLRWERPAAVSSRPLPPASARRVMSAPRRLLRSHPSRLPAVCATVLGIAATCTGCDRPQSMLAPGGPRAAIIADIWWAMFWGGLVIQTLVVGLAVYVLWWRGRRPRIGRNAFVIGGGLLLPVTVLTALLLYGFRTGALLSAPVASGLEIEIVGRQFWWEIRYPGEPPVTVAGVLRIP